MIYARITELSQIESLQPAPPDVKEISPEISQDTQKEKSPTQVEASTIDSRGLKSQTNITEGVESNDNLSTDLVAKFKSEWCSHIDNDTKGFFTFKDIATGDLCLAPDIIISNILKFQPYQGIMKNLLDLSNEYSLVSFILDSSESERISNKDYQFKYAELTVLTDIKKIYLSKFTMGVCPEDKTNSLNEGNSFRKAIESKYGKIDGSVSESEVQNELVYGGENKRKQIIQEAQDYDTKALISLLDAKVKSISKDLVNTLFWDKDGQKALLITKNIDMSEMCGTDDYFIFVYNPSVRLVELFDKERKAEDAAQQKYQQNAITPKF